MVPQRMQRAAEIAFMRNRQTGKAVFEIDGFKCFVRAHDRTVEVNNIPVKV